MYWNGDGRMIDFSLPRPSVGSRKMPLDRLIRTYRANRPPWKAAARSITTLTFGAKTTPATLLGPVPRRDEMSVEVDRPEDGAFAECECAADVEVHGPRAGDHELGLSFQDDVGQVDVQLGLGRAEGLYSHRPAVFHMERAPGHGLLGSRLHDGIRRRLAAGLGGGRGGVGTDD